MFYASADGENGSQPVFETFSSKPAAVRWVDEHIAGDVEDENGYQVYLKFPEPVFV